VPDPFLDAAVEREAHTMYREMLVRLGLGDVACEACARALLPAPLNWESYTFTTVSGRSWTWDVECARALVAGRAPAQRLALGPEDVQAWLSNHGQVKEEHLAHIPMDRIDEAVLLAATPDGQGHVMIDGSHRATIRIRAGLTVEGVLLSSVESMLAIEVVPLAMQRVAMEVRRRGLLPGDFRR